MRKKCSQDTCYSAPHHQYYPLQVSEKPKKNFHRWNFNKNNVTRELNEWILIIASHQLLPREQGWHRMSLSMMRNLRFLSLHPLLLFSPLHRHKGPASSIDKMQWLYYKTSFTLITTFVIHDTFAID